MGSPLFMRIGFISPKLGRLFLLPMLIAAGLFACENGPSTLAPGAGPAMTIVPPEDEIRVGENVLLTVVFRDGLERQVIWRTADSAIISISPSGVVTGKAPGSATVIARLNFDHAQASILVSPAFYSPVARVEVEPPGGSVPAGESLQLNARAVDENGNELAGRPVTWTSSAEAVAVVSQTGRVTGLAVGTVTITATSQGKGTPVTVIVTAPAPGLVARVEVAPPGGSVLEGGTLKLSATARSAQGDVLPGRAIAWTTSSENVASVSAAGVVTGVAGGTATITATSENASDHVTVIVIPRSAAPVALLTSDTTSLVFEAAGEAEAITVTARDAFGHALPGREVTWMVTNAEVVSVAASGASAEIRALAPGVTRVVARAEGKALAIEVLVRGIRPAHLTSVVASSTHTCGIDQHGQLFCWGGNNRGQLGTGDELDRPGAAPARRGETFKFVATGGWRSCGIDEDDVTHCWGDANPKSITNQKFSKLALGDMHICGITIKDNSLYCWGSNDHGELGIGSRIASSAPAGSSWNFSDISVAKSGATVIVGGYSCAIWKSGHPFCWGDATAGRLGSGSGEDVLAPKAIAFSQQGSYPFTSVATGDYHACAIAQDGVAYCWGQNVFGQIGTGSASVSVTFPTPVAGGLRFSSITAGGSSTCGITTSGVSYCWGDNGQGKLGVGPGQSDCSNTNCRTSPTPVVGSLSFRQLSVGQYHTCGITTSSEVYCWGINYNGRLGVNSALASANAPQRVIAVY